MIKLEAELRSAMRNDEFRLHYQPIHDLRSQKIAGLEALIRWKSPTRGEIMPAAFMPLAEATSLVVPIGNWVIDAGLKDFHRFSRRGRRSPDPQFQSRPSARWKAQIFLPFLSESVWRVAFHRRASNSRCSSATFFSQKWSQAGYKTAPTRGFGISARRLRHRVFKSAIPAGIPARSAEDRSLIRERVSVSSPKVSASARQSLSSPRRSASALLLKVLRRCSRCACYRSWAAIMHRVISFRRRSGPKRFTSGWARSSSAGGGAHVEPVRTFFRTSTL
jgi:hypothetical protein